MVCTGRIDDGVVDVNLADVDFIVVSFDVVVSFDTVGLLNAVDGFVDGDLVNAGFVNP